MKKILVSFVLLSLLIVGCSKEPRYVGEKNLDDVPVTMGIDRKDFERAANEAIDDLLKSGALDRKGGGRYVVAIGKVVNDTTQRIDTDMLIKKIRIAMLKSGKAVITTAVGANGAEEKMTEEVRKLRDNDEFKQNTIAKKGTIYAPDLALSGKIIQRTVKTYDDEQLVEYYFQLTLTHLESGLAFWEGETVIGKLGSNDSVTW
jgi:uncharacterized protein (TIGR02722 family)